MGLLIRNSNHGSNGCDIGDRWSCVIPLVMGMAWTHTGVPEMLLIVTVKAMMLRAMPPIGLSMGVVKFRMILEMRIGVGLGAEGV